MRTRVITALVMAVVLVPLLFVSEIWLMSVLGVFTAGAAYEYVRMMEVQKELAFFLKGLFIGAALTTYAVTLMVFVGIIVPMSLVIWLMFWMLVWLGALALAPNFPTGSVASVFIGMFYTSVPFAAISFLFFEGIEYLIFVILITMVSDIFAYFVGMRFGKHKLHPHVSPNKSIEGAIGGTVIASVVATIYAATLGLFAFEPFAGYIGGLLLLSVALSIVSQLGDLVASALKRNHDIKDFSNLFPGHGGILDRFDSTMFAAVLLAMVILASGGVL